MRVHDHIHVCIHDNNSHYQRHLHNHQGREAALLGGVLSVWVLMPFPIVVSPCLVAYGYRRCGRLVEGCASRAGLWWVSLPLDLLGLAPQGEIQCLPLLP
ncbi:hypothetical protein XENOCAPTIV_028916 [Xenoophorus captivus]|uniref:Uncharacterized protein n=1 Tax=Xenoophorus captivus TaxID=1517983 RepID=A0ABV0Q447_9TELE